MLDVKDGGRGVFVCSSPGPDPYSSQDLYNPVYEELSNGEQFYPFKQTLLIQNLKKLELF